MTPHCKVVVCDGCRTKLITERYDDVYAWREAAAAGWHEIWMVGEYRLETEHLCPACWERRLADEPQGC